MKEKIKEALKTKYKALGLADSVIDGVAESLEKTVTKEEDIETAVAGVEGILKPFQKEADKMRNEKTAALKELDEFKKKSEKKEPKEDEDEVKFPEGTSEEMKALFLSQQKTIKEQGEAFKAMQESLAAMQSGNVNQKRKTQMEEALKDAPAEYKESIMSGFEFMSFDDDTKFGSYLDGVQTKAREAAAKASSYVPGSGRTPSGEVSDKEVEDLAKDLI